MTIEIVTPEATLYKGDADSISLPGVHGEFQILNNHAPIVSLLQKGYVKIQGNISLEEEVEKRFEKKGKSYWLPINSGTIEMNNNKVIVLTD